MTNCRACKFCYLDDMDFICGHSNAGQFGKLVRITSSENGHCGINRPKFKQHPLREENGDLKL